MGVRSRNHYLGYVFGGLWFIGILSAAMLTGSLFQSFRSRNFVEETVPLTQPPTGKLYLDVTPGNINYRYYSSDWFGDWDGEWPLFGANLDSIMLNTVRVDVVKSNDNDFHVAEVKFSRGYNPNVARAAAEKISFNVTQRDSVLQLPKGFAISKHEKFRNQQVLLILQVPVNKRFYLDRSVSRYDWFDVRYNRRGGFDIDDNWERTYGVESGREYVMTPDGPKKVDDLDPEALKRGEYKEKSRENNQEEGDNQQNSKEPAAPPHNGNDSNKAKGYRYHGNDKNDKKDTANVKDRSTATATL
jgi:hypothetical protein